MISPLLLYAVSAAVFLAPIPFLFVFHFFTIMRAVVFLFALDSVLTLEAAYIADVVSIAVLHIITVPVFFGLIFFDLMQHHKNQFRCFLCGKEIVSGENREAVKRIVFGRPTEVYVHERCVSPGERKGMSERAFRKGIPK